MKTRELFTWILIGAALRISLTVGRFLWYDEAFTGLLASRSLPDLLAGTAADVHPPLYYLLVWPLAHLGGPEWLIRLPSLVAGLLAIWLMSRLGPAFGFDARLTRALVIATALTPAQIWYSAEARQYAPLTALFMATAWAVARRRWGWFGLGVVAMAYTHNYGLFYAAALALLGLARHPRDIWPIARAALLSAAAWIPWGITLAGQIAEIDGRYWLEPINTGAVATSLVVLLAGFDLQGGMMLAAAVLSLTLLMMGLLKRPPLALLMMGIAPPALAGLASLTVTDLWLFRGLVPAQPFLVGLAVWPFIRAWESKAARALAALLLVPLLLAGIISQQQTGLSDAENSAAHALTVIRAGWQEGDVILHMTDGSAVHLGLKAADLPQLKLTDCAHTPGALTDATRRALGFVEVESLPTATYRRAWLATGIGINTPPCMMDNTRALVGDMQPAYTHPAKDYFVDQIYIVDLGN